VSSRLTISSGRDASGKRCSAPAALGERHEDEGRGLQTRTGGVELGVHQRGPGPGDRWSLPYFQVADVEPALARVVELGGAVVHSGVRRAICRDSEGSPFGLADGSAG
jgi:predicted enzyme related to lactoylglutathione lyase